MINLKAVLQKSAIIGFSAISLSTLAISAQAANLVTNGSFNDFTGGSLVNSNTPGTNPSQLGNSTTVNGRTGYTVLNGWTLQNRNSVTIPNEGNNNRLAYGFLMNPDTDDITTIGSRSPEFNNNFSLWGPSNSSNNGLTGSPDGGNYIALDGDTAYRGGGISQTISGLTVGQQYYVNFSWAAAQQYGYDLATTEQVQVNFAGSNQLTSVYNLPEHGFSGWFNQTFTFTANSTSSALNFLALGTPGAQPPFVLLDGISVKAVPEPLTILGAGTAIAFGAFFKRKQANKDKD